jgi:polysaccharide transporter, PST family
MKGLTWSRQLTPELAAIFKNTSWLLLDRVLRMTVGFAIGVWIARYLGVEQYGLFSYATAFVYLFSPLVSLGLDNIVVRDLVQQSDAKDTILGTTFWLRVVGSGVSVGLAIATILVVRPNDPGTASLVAILSIAGLFQSMDVVDLWFQSQVQSQYVVVAKSAVFFAIALLKMALILFQAPLVAFAGAGLLDVGLSAIALAVVYRRRGHSWRRWCWHRQRAKVLLKEGFPLMLSCITIMIYMKIDQIMLGNMVGDQSVGIYTAATRLSEAWYFIPTVIISSVTPSIYKARERSEADYYHSVSRLMRLMNAIAIAIAIPITVFAPTIIQRCYGAAYLQSSTVLVVHIWAAIFVFMGLTTIPCFIVDGLTHLALRRTVLGAAINVGLNLVFIPHYTVTGAAIATVISQAVASYISHAFHPQTAKMFWLQTRSLLFLP